MKLQFNYNDGGRSNYFKATKVGDCVTRAVAIATNRDYKEVYNEIAKIIGYTPREGVKKSDTKKVMQHFGGKWVAKMGIGTGCKCHLAKDEVLMNKIIVCNLSCHVTAVVNGVINDTYDCSRGGTRCVYGYWVF